MTAMGVHSCADISLQKFFGRGVEGAAPYGEIRHYGNEQEKIPKISSKILILIFVKKIIRQNLQHFTTKWKKGGL